MNEIMRQILLENIKMYEKAIKVEPPLKRDHLNDIRSSFFIITCMRNRYGCPACSSVPKCKCKVLSSISPYVNTGRDYPPILW